MKLKSITVIWIKTQAIKYCLNYNLTIMKKFIKHLKISHIIILLAILNSCDEYPKYSFMETNPPLADFSYEFNNLEVIFTNNSSHSTTYVWDFGDGATSEDKNPVHQYSKKNNYTVTLTASDNNKVSDVFSTTIAVGYPAALFNYEVKRYTATFFNTSANATSFLWDFGDGETSSEENPVHVYDAKGTYNVKLLVSDDSDEDSMEQEIFVPGKFIPEIISPSFERDSYKTDWDWNGASATGAPTPPDGKRGCKISSPDAWIAQTLKVDDETNYTIKFWFVTKKTNLPMGARLLIIDADNPDNVIVDHSTGPSSKSNKYQEGSLSFNTGGATSIILKIMYGDGEFRIDNFSIE
jgi:PKD repeat protein